MNLPCNKKISLGLLIWSLVLGQIDISPVYALAPQSLFQKNSTTGSVDEPRPSVLSEIKLMSVVSAIGKHCFVKSHRVRTIPKMLRSEFGLDPSFYSGLDLGDSSTFTLRDHIISIRYKDPSDGSARFVKITPHDMIAPGDTRWAIHGEFGIDDGKNNAVSSAAIAIAGMMAREKVVEIVLVSGILQAHILRPDGSRQPSEIRTIFNSEEAGRFVDYLKSNKIGNVTATFRVTLEDAGFGWNSVAEHTAVSALGREDGVVYIGRDLLKRMFQKDGEVLRDEILRKDLFMNLKGEPVLAEEEHSLRSRFVTTALENIRLRSESSEMKIPDFSRVSLHKIIEEAPDVADYQRLHSDKCMTFESSIGFGESKRKVDCYYFSGDGEIIREGKSDTYKVLRHQNIYTPDGIFAGSLLIYYHINPNEEKPEDQDNSVTMILRGASRKRAIIPGSDTERGEEGWDEAIIKAYLDKNSDRVTMIDYKVNPTKMNLSRTAIGIMLDDAGMNGELKALCGLINEYLVFPELTQDVRIRERRDEIPIPTTVVRRVTADPGHAREEDIKAIEDFAYYKSWTVRQIAMDVIASVCKAGRIPSARAALAEAYFGNVDILEDRLFIKRFLIEKPGLLEKVFSAVSGQSSVRTSDISSVEIKWLGKGNNKSVYRVRFNTKDGKSFMVAVSTVRHNPRNPNFDRPSLEKSIERWVKLSEDGHESVPRIIEYQWANDFRPRMTDLIPDMYSVYDKNDKYWVRNDIGVVFRTFKEGDDLDWTLSNPVLSTQEKMKIKKAALDTYLDIWNSTRTADGRGQFIGDPKPANIVVWREGEAYRAQAIDLDLLREFKSFEDVKRTLRMYHEYDDMDIFESGGKAMVLERKAGDDVPDKLREVITNQSLYKMMAKIHGMNCELLPILPKGMILTHLISEELIPVNILSDFKAMAVRLKLEYPDMSERIEVLKASDIPSRMTAIIAKGGKADAALPGSAYLKDIPRTAKALVFETEKDPGALDFVQVEGIITALRALERQDTAALLKIYAILANMEFSGNVADISKYIDEGDWQAVARTVIFRLKPVEIHNLKDLKKLNDRLLDFIKYA